MPKVYSRGTNTSDEQARLTASSRAILRSYYCICGEFVLVMQGKMDRLPRRRTDGTHIIRSRHTRDGKIQARKFKLNVKVGERVMIKRTPSQEGKKSRLELRQQLICARCKSTAYQTDLPPAGDSPFVYILPGALTEVQGRIPLDAFDGELGLDLDDEDPDKTTQQEANDTGAPPDDQDKQEGPSIVQSVPKTVA